MPVRRKDGLWLPMREVIPVLVHELGEPIETVEEVIRSLLMSSGCREITSGDFICFIFLHDELRIATALSPDCEALACTHKVVLDGLRRRIADKRAVKAVHRELLNTKRLVLNGRRQQRRLRSSQRRMALT